MANEDRHPNWSGEHSDEAASATASRRDGTDPRASVVRDVGSDSRPRVIGERYQVLSLLGSGSMGTVYKARDLELDETVALKVLRAELPLAEAAVELFRTEVKLARRVTHANVARVFDIGQNGDSKFLTMEYIDGRSLADLMVKGRGMSATRLLEIARAITAGLAAAHAANVVHHDLKPENVLITADGRVVVTDFGIARAFEQPSVSASRELSCAPIGSPAYMSPEQVAGRITDPRSDIYSLGVVLYEALAGSLPTSSRAFGSDQRAALEKLRPGLPRGLAALVGRCLAHRPEDRFRNALELMEALDAIAPASGRAVEKPTEKPLEKPVDDAMGGLRHRARRAMRRGFALGFGEAVELYRELIDSEPNDPALLSGFASASLWHWFFAAPGANQCRADGEQALARALAIAPDAVEPRLVNVQQLWNLGRAREAATAVVEVLNLGGQSLDVLELLGFLMREAGLCQGARIELERALRIDPESFAANVELSRLSALEGDWETADRFMDRVTQPADQALTAGRRRFAIRMAFWRRDHVTARRLMSEGEPTVGSLDMLFRLALQDDSKIPMQQFFKTADRRDACPRAVATLRQIEAEMACLQDDVEWALLAVSRAMEAGLVDSLWLSRCPVLEVVRRDPRSAKLMTRMEEQARLVRHVYESAEVMRERARASRHTDPLRAEEGFS